MQHSVIPAMKMFLLLLKINFYENRPPQRYRHQTHKGNA
jgi:hypothetical protein